MPTTEELEERVARATRAHQRYLTQEKWARREYHDKYHQARGARGLFIVLEQATSARRQNGPELQAAREYLKRVYARLQRLEAEANRLHLQTTKAFDALQRAQEKLAARRHPQDSHTTEGGETMIAKELEGKFFAAADEYFKARRTTLEAAQQTIHRYACAQAVKYFMEAIEIFAKGAEGRSITPEALCEFAREYSAREFRMVDRELRFLAGMSASVAPAREEYERAQSALKAAEEAKAAQKRGAL